MRWRRARRRRCALLWPHRVAAALQSSLYFQGHCSFSRSGQQHGSGQQMEPDTMEWQQAGEQFLWHHLPPGLLQRIARCVAGCEADLAATKVVLRLVCEAWRAALPLGEAAAGRCAQQTPEGRDAAAAIPPAPAPPPHAAVRSPVPQARPCQPASGGGSHPCRWPLRLTPSPWRCWRRCRTPPPARCPGWRCFSACARCSCATSMRMLPCRPSAASHCCNSWMPRVRQPMSYSAAALHACF